MYLLSLVIAPTGAARTQSLTAARVVEFLNAAAEIDDQLEHISARAGPNRLHLGFFYRTPDGNARELCLRALCGNAELAGWQIID